jgi:hypothetical protein
MTLLSSVTKAHGSTGEVARQDMATILFARTGLWDALPTTLFAIHNVLVVLAIE